MPRTCTVCTHESRAEIDRALVRRTSYRDISRQYEVSKDSLSRHAQEHLPDKLKKAEEAERQEEADELLGDLRKIQIHTVKVLRRAEADEDWWLVLKAVAEQRQNIQLRFRAVDQKAIEQRLDEIEQEQGRSR